MVMTSTGPVSLNILVPAMPKLTELMHTDVGTVQLTLSLFLLSLAVSQLVLGPLSDRFGRRPVVLGGLGARNARLACRHRRSIGRVADRSPASCRRSAPRPGS